MTDDGGRDVILHVSDDPTDVQRALEAASGLRAADGRTQVRIVVNGEALTALVGPASIAVPEGVQVSACATGLARRGIDPDALPPAVHSTPSAVAAVVDAQLAGAAYVRI